MKIKVTHPIPYTEMLVGHVYEVTDGLAKDWIELDWAFEVKEEQPEPVKPKNKKEVKDGDG